MGEWKKICCAVDLSESSRRALEAASDLASRLRADLTLLYVNGASSNAVGEAGVSPSELVARTNREIRPQVNRWASEVVGRPVSTAMLSGDPADEILSFLRDRPADLLVLGTHTRTGFARWLVGSVAESVARRSACPVLLVRTP